MLKNRSLKDLDFSAFLLYAANALLLLSLFAIRATRIEGSDTAYWSPQFVALLVGAVVVVSLTTWAAYTGRLRERVGALARSRRMSVLGGWTVASYAALIVVPAIFTFLQPYLLPFVVWLTLSNAALLMMGLSRETAPGPPPGVEHPARLRRGLLSRMLPPVVALLMPLVVAELGLRIGFTYFGSEYDRAAYTYTAEQIAQTQRLFQPQPYTNYGLSPEHPEHNSLGYRGPEIVQPKPAGVFRIVALGGSTTYGISLPMDRTYPAQLQQILRDEYGYTQVEVINAGVMGYNSWDLLAEFEYRVLDLNPDMIVVYEGINDVVARLVDPRYYNGANRARGAWRTDYPALSPSVLYRFLAIKLGWMQDPTALNSLFLVESGIQTCTPVRCPGLPLTPQEVLAANPPIYYERNLNNLIALAQANNVQALLSSWAYFPDPMGADIDPFMTYPHIQQAVAENNAIVAQLAEKWSLPYYDLAGSIPYNRDFWLDGLHLSELGAHEQAERYAAFLHESGLLPAPDR